MDIDRSAPATAEGAIEIAAPPETVWSVLADLASWPSWNHDVRSLELEGPVEPGTRFRWKSKGATLVSTLQVVDPPAEMAWTGVTMRIHAVHVFRLTSTDTGTRLRSEESWRGLIPSVLTGYSRKTLQRGIDDVLAAVKSQSERRASSSRS